MLNAKIAPMGVEAAEVGCPNHQCRTWWKNVPELAAHRWTAHGVEIPETYAEFEYREKGDPMACGACGKAGHNAKTCQKATNGAAPAKPPERVAATKAPVKKARATKPSAPHVGHWPKRVMVRGLAIEVANWDELGTLIQRFGV